MIDDTKSNTDTTELKLTHAFHVIYSHNIIK